MYNAYAVVLQMKYYYFNSREMKSISIVYKRPKTLKHSSHNKQQPIQPDIRTFTNDFFTRVANKGSVDNSPERNRSQTAKAQLLRNRKNIFSSLNIASIITSIQPTIVQKSNKQKRYPSVSMFNIRKPKQENLLFLKIPDLNGDTSPTIEKKLFRDTAREIIKHAKVKPLTKIKCQKDVTLIISVDFIYNEFNIWGEEEIEQSAQKTWKAILPLANLIWVVRYESTAKKILSFTQGKGLRLDGILQIENAKKQPLTISYASLQQQAKFTKNQKILIINSIRSDPQQQPSQLDFRATLPIIQHPSTFVHYVYIDIANKNRIKVLKKVVSSQLPSPFDIHPIIQEHRQKKGRIINHWKKEQLLPEDYQKEFQNVSKQLQRIKQNLLLYFDQSFGLKTKIDGDSLTYIIGDSLKRNYNIAKQYYKYCMAVRQRDEGKQSIPGSPISKKIRAYQYNRNVYIWYP